MYNEIFSRELGRSRMNEAQELVQNDKLLSSIKEQTDQEDGRTENNPLSLKLSAVLQLFTAYL